MDLEQNLDNIIKSLEKVRREPTSLVEDILLSSLCYLCLSLKDSPLLTTAETTPTAPMLDREWGVPVEPTIPMTTPSSQSVPAGIPNGPAEQDSECAHHAAMNLQILAHYNGGKLMVRCLACGVLIWFEKIPVPAAGTGL